MNLATNLERSAFYFPDHVAVIEEDREVSFQEFNQDSNRIATALIRSGVKPGDHVALCAPNSYPWLTFYFGVLKAGAVAVTLSNALSKTELTHALNDATPKIHFTTDEKLDGLTSFKVPKEFIVLDELPKGTTGKILKRELKRQVVSKLKK